MKIIDLLNKIANGEEVPKKILFNDYVYCWEEGIDYERVDGGKTIFLLSSRPITEDFLESEVEILEEDKKIEKLDFDFKLEDETDFVNKYPRISYMIETQKNMINKIIDEINKLKENNEPK